MELPQEFIDDVLDLGEDDDVQFIDLAYLLKEDTGEEANLVERTVDSAIILMDRGYLYPGDIVDNMFHRWKAPREEIIERFRQGQQEVMRGEGQFNFGDICWFHTSSYSGPGEAS
ncbi:MULTISPECIES: hypothetical protein [Actinopolyspora]|uniref:Uncharacterized protein n=1 Tax=Actinopolyspora biskrensis TaxID=1470178 RepID=A0A852ZBX4_9ACTN|nr:MULTISPECIES: hypothetical protein [Actinopolyspora]NYH80147.1 hypothetical protein [Actinopolyspora biskrensis]